MKIVGAYGTGRLRDGEFFLYCLESFATNKFKRDVNGRREGREGGNGEGKGKRGSKKGGQD